MSAAARQRHARRVRDLPAALERPGEIRERIDGRPVAAGLDYDGTLAPIVDDPARAEIPPDTLLALRRLARRCPVAILSGRDLEDIRARVGLEGIHYAGSHGFDLVGPDGFRERRAEDHLRSLDTAEEELRAAVGELPGVTVERKRFAVAVHHRRTPRGRVPAVRKRARRVSGAHGDLALSRGKEVVELRPAVDWGKGRALLRLLERMGLEPGGSCPVYVGDDVTDEDAFEVLEGRGLPLIVRDGDDDRPTRAEYALDGPSAVRRFLETLAGILQDGGRRGG